MPLERRLLARGRHLSRPANDFVQSASQT